jgi:hypothetical protein
MGGMNNNFIDSAESTFLTRLTLLKKWKNAINIKRIVEDLLTLLEYWGQYTPLNLSKLIDTSFSPFIYTSDWLVRM